MNSGEINYSHRLHGVPNKETASVLEMAEHTGQAPRRVVSALSNSRLLDKGQSNDLYLIHSNGASDLPVFPVELNRFPDGLTAEKLTRLLSEFGL